MMSIQCNQANNDELERLFSTYIHIPVEYCLYVLSFTLQYRMIKHIHIDDHLPFDFYGYIFFDQENNFLD